MVNHNVLPTDIKPDLTKLVDQGPAKEGSLLVGLNGIAVNMDPASKEVYNAQCAKVQMCECANRVDMDPSSK